MHPHLFLGVHAGGIAYCDTSREVHGDYVCVAFLSFATLALTIVDAPPELLQDIQVHAASLQGRRGETFTVSTAGQTVRLGGAA